MTKEEGKIIIGELYHEISKLKNTNDSEEEIKILKLEIQRVFKLFSEKLEPIERVRLRFDLGIIALEVENKDFQRPGYRSLNTISVNEKIEKENIEKALNFISKLSKSKKEKVHKLLLEVKNIQDSDLSNGEKTSKIKSLLWTNQNVKSKIIIGGLIGTLLGLAIFGTGGIGIAGLGGAIGVWGFLSGTMGGVLISSLIVNFEKKNDIKKPSSFLSDEGF